jgi:HD-GYP domain-containing protein (c-di-GMP phosphodiesterase class II)
MAVIRILKKQLRKGMYIESVECPHFMFDKRRFVLDQDADLEAIWATSGEYVLINTSKGRLALASGADAAEAEAIRQKASDSIVRSLQSLRASFNDMTSGEGQGIDRFRPLAKEMVENMVSAPTIVTELTRLKTKDEGTFMHSLAVGALMSGLGMSLGLDAETVELLSISGILHDFGKLLIPDAILKKQGPLTAVERHVIRNHPELGYQRLTTYADMPQMVLDVCRSHHELLDGSGYPRGLSGNEISLPVRIATVCDVYDALTSPRPYKKGWSDDEAISWMFEKDKLFDRKLLVRLSEVTNGIKRD